MSVLGEKRGKLFRIAIDESQTHLVVCYLSQEVGWKALGYTVGISEVPLMILLGYLIGRRIGRETEGIAIGGLVGAVLFATFIIWAVKKSKGMRSSGGKASGPPTTGPLTL